MCGDSESRISFTRIARRWPDVKLFFADGGSVAVEMALEKVPDVIVLDARLPHTGALMLVNRLRKTTATSRTPIVVLGADPSGREKKRFAEAGADYYFTRPLNVATVDTTVLGLLELAALR